MVGYLAMLQYHSEFMAAFPDGEVAPLNPRTLDTPQELLNALSREWTDAHMFYDLANLHPTEGDSEGSMLTRSGLVLLYSMLAAHLSFLGKLGLHMSADAFDEKARNYFNEVDYEMDASGNARLVPVKQRFEDRANIVPSLIAAKLCPNKLEFSRGDGWYQNTFKKYFELRNGVMHSKFGECQPRVSKGELKQAFESVRAYFMHMSTAGGIFRIYETLLTRTPLRTLDPTGAPACRTRQRRQRAGSCRPGSARRHGGAIH